MEGKNEWMERRSAKKREGWRGGSGDGGGGVYGEEGAMQKVNCWSEVFIGSAGGREQEWEYALKTTV